MPTDERPDAARIPIEWPNLGVDDGADIEAVAFLVLMEAAKSAQEDLKSIMDGVRAINAAKQRWREILCQVNRDVAAAAVAHEEGKDIAFSPDGLGGADAYRAVTVAIPDPEAPQFVRETTVALVDAQLRSLRQLEAVKEAIRNKLDSMSELGEMESLRLQMAMDRRSKMMSTLSNMLKKMSDTSQSITQNLK
jgi:hypothetical protein